MFWEGGHGTGWIAVWRLVLILNLIYLTPGFKGTGGNYNKLVSCCDNDDNRLLLNNVFKVDSDRFPLYLKLYFLLSIETLKDCDKTPFLKSCV